MGSVERALAVIPARGGSKRVPRKNVRLFHGVPLVGRAIGTAISTGLFETVIVSTDDPEIAEVARHFGAETPFVRPASLSDDWTETAPVVAHAIQEVASDMGRFSAVCCIYPGAVLTTVADLVESSFLVSEANNRNAVVAAVVRYGHPIQRALRRGADDLLEPREGAKFLRMRSQDLESTWHDAGQFYWASPARWCVDVPLLSSVLPYEVPLWRTQDIDTLDDWVRAETLFEISRQTDSG